MGKVSDGIRELIERQVADCGIVVWYDPDKVYESILSPRKCGSPFPASPDGVGLTLAEFR